ncbi:MAG: ParB/RepB/Spo0J family partition protein [Leptolyngbyaceae cyanobacterium]
MAHTKPKPRDRGAIDFLLSTGIDEPEANPDHETNVQWLDLNQIQTRPQPRRYFDTQKLQELASSFTTQGFKGAINVRPVGQSAYELVAGERRYRAAKLANLDKVRCFVDNYTEQEALRFALAENLLREDLSKLEEIEGILQLIEVEHNIAPEYTIKLIQSEGHHRKQTGGNVSPSKEFQQVEAILNYFGIKVETFRTKYLKGLNLPDTIKQAHLEGKLAFNAALELGKIKDETTREILLNEALTDALSFRDLQAKTREVLANKPAQVQSSTSPLQALSEAYQRLKRSKAVKKLNAQQTKKLQKIQTLMEALVEEIEG